MNLICNTRTAVVAMKIIHISCLIGEYVTLNLTKHAIVSYASHYFNAVIIYRVFHLRSS